MFGGTGGYDTITDFGPTKAFNERTGKFTGWDHDRIVIKAGKAKSFSDLTIGENANGDAVITGYSSGTGASVTLEGVTASELTESDFEFLG